MKDCIFSNNLYHWGLGNSLEARELAAIPSDLSLVVATIVTLIPGISHTLLASMGSCTHNTHNTQYSQYPHIDTHTYN